jgi:diguanylate cyclase (GGDEF)-like protein
MPRRTPRHLVNTPPLAWTAAAGRRACAGLGLVALSLGLWLAGPAAATAAPAPVAFARPAVVAPASPLETLERLADIQPEQALAQVGALIQTLPAPGAARVQALALQGVVLAGRHLAEAAAEPLRALEAQAPGQPLAAAAAGLVRAAIARDAGLVRRADQQATDALAALPVDAPPALRMRLLQMLAGLKEDRGQLDEAVRLRLQAVDLADAMGSPSRRGEARSQLALTLRSAGQSERGQALSNEAMALLRQAGERGSLARALNVESFFRSDAGDLEGELRVMREAIEQARLADARQLQVLIMANLSDHYLKRGAFDTALKLAREALPLARALDDRRSEGVALGNLGLALISLHQLDEGLREAQAAIALSQRTGALAYQAEGEAELGGYLERAGYLREAVAAYQRHRALADELSRRDQQRAIVELQETQDHERRQQALALLQREADLQQAQLLNQQLTQRLWAAGALAALLLLGVVTVLLRRLIRHNAALKEGNALLRTLSEHDPLTGLANRHHLQRLRQAPPDGPAPPFEGALLLIDIDHFKRVNDRHGHAAGDSVLVETARRLRASLDEGDLVLRWGGEEFLVVARARPQAQLDALAQRLLCAVGERLVPHEGQGIPVTASIGYASFPTQPTPLPLSWERALALVDTALYLAKAHGRNLAYGVRQLHAQDADELAQISHALEDAWRAGRVQLTATRGPARSGAARPPSEVAA